jgi:hypothetical protein
MDFFDVVLDPDAKKGPVVYPGFRGRKSKDIMIKDGKFKAIWSERLGCWSEDLDELIQIVDDELRVEANRLNAIPKLLVNTENRMMYSFEQYCKTRPDTPATLNQVFVFASDPPRKEDYSSVRLPYDIKEGSIEYYEKFISCCYDPIERHKLEWAVGAILAGDQDKIQKFVSIYGEPGTGKGTFLDILAQLFYGYWVPFNAKKLASNQRNFAASVFRNNPKVAIQYDGSLRDVQDNTVLNTIVAREAQGLEAKYRDEVQIEVHTFLFLGTNDLIEITNNSGLNRRLIDAYTNGNELDDFDIITGRIRFEIGAIAYHCREVYREAGPHRYDAYKPEFMQVHTNQFRMFMSEHDDYFLGKEGVTTTEAYNLYNQWFEAGNYPKRLDRTTFELELKKCYTKFELRAFVRGHDVRRWHSGFRLRSLGNTPAFVKPPPSLVMDETTSLLDELLTAMPAQYADEDGKPPKKWENVKTKLKDLDTTRLHYVKVPENHIVIDFDLRGDDGQKSAELNLEAASELKPTYSEYSMSGRGIHLHYIYVGDVETLAREYGPGIEVKTYPGDSSLRRRLSTCNNIPVEEMFDGLPLKEKKKVLNPKTTQDERHLRSQILKGLNKEVHPYTKPSIDFIHHILEEAYASGMPYDVSDMKQRILVFALSSSNQAEYCIARVNDMKFSSEAEIEAGPEPEDTRLVFYDVEVFPNLFVVCWKVEGVDTVYRMLNPSSSDVEELLKRRLVGFNNRRYDNHILYARGVMGYSNEELFKLSQRIIARGDQNAMFGAAYSLSYADILDISSVKATLKKFQIDLGLNHKELGLPWDEPVPEELWPQVLDYCENDVRTEEAVFNARRQDFAARQMLSALSGLPVNQTTYNHTAKIIFGDVKQPQADFVYTNLSGIFPGYVYDFGKSTYKGEVVGEGGYVYSEPGMYQDVAVLDVASMHPTSIELLDLFGPYTKNFADLKAARIAIKRRDYDRARRLLGGALAPYLSSEEDADALAYALKIVINTVYGLTSASFDNAFRDIRNKDNIVAKRGALFMIDLKNAVQSRGYQVIHIKTDSIKIPGADSAIIEFVTKFGEDYGYEFEYEAHYDKFCLINDADYVGKGGVPSTWTAVGVQFSRPYVFKTLFSHEPLVFEDFCETKEVRKGYIYLDSGNGPQFIGGAGSFVPVREGTGGGRLIRIDGDKQGAVSGTKDYFWKEAVVVKDLGLEDDIDMSYFEKLKETAVKALANFGDVDEFIS